MIVRCYIYTSYMVLGIAFFSCGFAVTWLKLFFRCYKGRAVEYPAISKRIEILVSHFNFDVVILPDYSFSHNEVIEIQFAKI